MSGNQIYAQINPSTASKRINGLRKRKLLEDRSFLKDIKFRNIDPDIMNGCVADIDVNSANPTKFYVTYATKD